MYLRDLPLKNAYDSDIDNILVDFYAPALSVSTQYDRLTGFFSSTSLSAAAKGISGLIRNGGNIRLITGAIFQEQDIIAIRAAIETRALVRKNNKPCDSIISCFHVGVDNCDKRYRSVLINRNVASCG